MLQCIGVLEALARDQGAGGGQLKHHGTQLPNIDQVDYVSSVSGGGYTGIGWLSHMCYGSDKQQRGLAESVDQLRDHAGAALGMLQLLSFSAALPLSLNLLIRRQRQKICTYSHTHYHLYLLC